jgi:opacity protein-like surface antigen
MRIRCLICGLAALAAPAAIAAQQDEHVRGIGVGVTLGGTVPVSDYRDFADGGWNVGGLLDLGRAAGPFGLRIEGMYHGFSDKNLVTLGGGATAVTIANSSRIVNGNLNLVVGVPATRSTIRPYLIGGGGVYGIRNSLECKSSTFCNRTFDQSSVTKFGLDGGAGVELGLSGFSAFVEGRYHHVFDALPDRRCVGLPGCGRTAARFLPFTFGLIYRL